MRTADRFAAGGREKMALQKNKTSRWGGFVFSVRRA
jgi:hypothetical protein